MTTRTRIREGQRERGRRDEELDIGDAGLDEVRGGRG